MHSVQDIYDRDFVGSVNKLPMVTLQQVLQGTVPHEAAKVQYSSDKEFETMAKQLKLMADLRVSVTRLARPYSLQHEPYYFLMQAGVPRTAYKGIVTFMYKNKRIHLVPKDTWQGYTNHK